jgi:hypothetical protein
VVDFGCVKCWMLDELHIDDMVETQVDDGQTLEHGGMARGRGLRLMFFLCGFAYGDRSMAACGIEELLNWISARDEAVILLWTAATENEYPIVSRMVCQSRRRSETCRYLVSGACLGHRRSIAPPTRSLIRTPPAAACYKILALLSSTACRPRCHPADIQTLGGSTVFEPVFPAASQYSIHSLQTPRLRQTSPM